MMDSKTSSSDVHEKYRPQFLALWEEKMAMDIANQGRKLDGKPPRFVGADFVRNLKEQKDLLEKRAKEMEAQEHVSGSSGSVGQS